MKKNMLMFNLKEQLKTSSSHPPKNNAQNSAGYSSSLSPSHLSFLFSNSLIPFSTLTPQ